MSRRWPDGAPAVMTMANKLLLESRLQRVAAAAPYSLRGETFATPWSRPTHISSHGWFILTGPIGAPTYAACPDVSLSFPT